METSHHTGQFGFLANSPPEKARKDIGGYFSSMRSGPLFAIIVLVYIGVIGIGGYIGRQRFLNGINEPESSIETAVAAVLGLLAFILGFTFSLTWSRFASRNNLVMLHAKAIGLCYLRAGLVTEKQKEEVRRLLYEYTTILYGIESQPDLARSLARINEIHIQLWAQTVSLVKENIDSAIRGLFVGSINDLVGVALERKTIALFIRVPDAIWRGLLLLAFIGMLAFGYQAGISGVVKWFQLPLLPIAFGLVIVLIADLNSQDTQRHFKVTKQPLKEVLEMMEKQIA